MTKLHNNRLRPLRALGQAGVTLVEMLLVMGLLAIFTGIMATIFVTIIDNQAQTEGYNATIADGRFIIARMDYDIMRATGAGGLGAITAPATLGATSTNLTMNIGGTTYNYAVTGGVLQLTDGTGTANISDSSVVVSGLSFLKLGNTGGLHTIRYTFTLTSTAHHGSGNDTQTFTSTVERRQI